MGGRVCHCTSCDPQFELDMETKMIRRLTREKKAELSAATQARTESDFRKEKQAGIENIEKTITSEYRANPRADIKKEILENLTRWLGT